jgi:hypothetical protein
LRRQVDRLEFPFFECAPSGWVMQWLVVLDLGLLNLSPDIVWAFW